MNIPLGNSKEDLKKREEIISQVYRRWTEENPVWQTQTSEERRKKPGTLYADTRNAL